MGMFKEFKDFAIKGNVIDLAIGVVIGAAFGKIVNSLIEDVITPMVLQPALKAAHLTDLKDLTAFGTVKYGTFLSAVINFVIVAWVLFIHQDPLKALVLSAALKQHVQNVEESRHPMGRTSPPVYPNSPDSNPTLHVLFPKVPSFQLSGT